MIVRLIGIVYRVPLTNILGDAIGVYTDVYSIYPVVSVISVLETARAFLRSAAGTT